MFFFPLCQTEALTRHQSVSHPAHSVYGLINKNISDSVNHSVFHREAVTGSEQSGFDYLFGIFSQTGYMRGFFYLTVKSAFY